MAGLVLAAGAAPAFAQGSAPTPLQQAIGNPDDFDLRGTVRLRYETLGGQPRAGFGESEEQLALRTTLLAEYDSGILRIGGEIYDSRAWLSRLAPR